MKANIFLSNVLENLVESLKTNLFNSSFSPFSKRVVVVPSTLMKTYLMMNIAKNPSFQVVAGVRFATLFQILREMGGKKMLKFIELSLLVEEELHQLVKENREEDRELLSYLSLPDQLLDRRIMQFADQLSSLFILYGIYGGERLAKWEKERGWQQKLWGRIFPEEALWSYPLKELSRGRQVDFPIHLFGFSFLPKVYFDFFEELKSQFYILSPCQYFWSDLRSNRQKFLKDEDDYEGNHSLLANLGKANRNFAKLFEESSFLHENYREEEGSCLKNLQRSLLNLEEIEWTEDDSIHLHATSSKLEEIELLFQYISHYLKTCQPKEIRVLAPDINKYLPFIDFVFGGKLEYVVHSVDRENANSFFHGLLHLIELPQLRFEKGAVLKLFYFPSFVEKTGFNQKELDHIYRWIDESKILWGLDGENRQSYLEEEPLEKSERGTWLFGLDSLLEELVVAASERASIDFTEAELFGKFATMICSFKERLTSLSKTKRSIPSWVEIVKALAEQYFILPREGEDFFRDLESLSLFSKEISFESLKKVMVHLLKEQESFQGSNVQIVHFASITPGAIIPSQITCLIGMQEGDFPRVEERPSFSFLHLNDLITKNDEDRALFMEILLSTRKSLYISYIHIDAKDGKKVAVSSLIQELKLKENYHPLPILPEIIKTAFFSEFYERSPFKEPIRESEILIDIKHLSLLGKHPIQFYFNRVLQIYLDKADETDPEFVFSHLNRALFRKEALRQPVAELIEKEGNRLPEGAFKKLAIERIKKEGEELVLRLEKMHLFPSEIFSIDLKLDCSEPIEGMLPPLTLPLSDHRRAIIFGKLPELSPEGMLFHGTHQLKDLVKIWPLYLVYLNLPLSGKRELLFTKNGKTIKPVSNPQERLRRYIEYYELALNNLSPLMPDWALSLVKGDVRELYKAMQTSFESPFFPDRYIDLIAVRDPLPKAETLIERWTPLIRDIYDFL